MDGLLDIVLYCVVAVCDGDGVYHRYFQGSIRLGLDIATPCGTDNTFDVAVETLEIKNYLHMCRHRIENCTAQKCLDASSSSSRTSHTGASSVRTPS